MEPLVWGLFRHAWKTENIQTVGAQPYLRCLARAISLPHSNRQSCNMNMQFYDHSGETHVLTRTSYAFCPRRTSPGLFGKLRTYGDAGAASAKYAGLYIVYVHCAASSTPRGKFWNSFLRECRVASRSFVRSFFAEYEPVVRRFRKWQTSESECPEGTSATVPRASPAFATNYIREKLAEIVSSSRLSPFDRSPLNYQNTAWVFRTNVTRWMTKAGFSDTSGLWLDDPI